MWRNVLRYTILWGIIQKNVKTISRGSEVAYMVDDLESVLVNPSQC